MYVYEVIRIEKTSDNHTTYSITQFTDLEDAVDAFLAEYDDIMSVVDEDISDIKTTSNTLEVYEKRTHMKYYLSLQTYSLYSTNLTYLYYCVHLQNRKAVITR